MTPEQRAKQYQQLLNIRYDLHVEMVETCLAWGWETVVETWPGEGDVEFLVGRVERGERLMGMELAGVLTTTRDVVGEDLESFYDIEGLSLSWGSGPFSDAAEHGDVLGISYFEGDGYVLVHLGGNGRVDVFKTGDTADYVIATANELRRHTRGAD